MEKWIRKISLCLAVLMILCCQAFLFSCSKIYDSVEYGYFNTIIRVQVENKKLTEQVKSELSTLFSQLEKDFDKENTTSLTYKYNNALPNQTIELTVHQNSVVNYSRLANQYSSGLFNPAIYPLLEVWQFSNYPIQNFKVPTSDQIQGALSKTINFNDLSFDSQNKTITKYEQSQLDFGGIVKGYAVDLAGKILENHGYQKGYVSIGASSLYILWADLLSVRNPINQSQNLLEIDLSSKNNFSLSTSGDYERYYIDSQNGQKYSHVLDANTGYPTTTGVRSVTVIGNDGAFEDAITTACLLLEHDHLTPSSSPLFLFLKKLLTDEKAQTVFAVYSKDGVNQIITNAKKGEDFTLLDDKFQIVNI